MTTHLDVETELVPFEGEEYEVVFYVYSIKLTGTGLVLYQKRYADGRDLLVAPVSIQYDIKFDAVASKGDVDAEAMFNSSSSYYLKRIFE